MRSALNSADDPETIEILFYVDDDDINSQVKLDSLQKQHHNVKGVVQPRIVMSSMQNVLFEHASGDIVMVGGDDLDFQTPGWNRQVEDAFAEVEDRILLVGGVDSTNPDIFCHPFISRRWCELIGCVFDGSVGDYIDLTLWEIAKGVNRIKQITAIIEHLHWSKQKREFDFTDREKANRSYNVQVTVKDWFDAALPQRKEKIRILQDYITNYEKGLI